MQVTETVTDGLKRKLKVVVAAGEIGVVPGPASAASDSVDITFHGKGGHGATPHQTIDPVVMAARAVANAG